MSAAEDYAAEAGAMVARARVFLRENPGLKASVQFNFPSATMVVATIQQGLEMHAISADAGGLQLLEAMSQGSAELTVLMLRVALAALGPDSGG